MLKLFSKKCPICKMKLAEGRENPKGFGREFCSESCKEEYRKRTEGKQSSSGQVCH